MICLSELASNKQEKKARWRVEGLVSPVPGGLSLPGANSAAVVGNITKSSDAWGSTKASAQDDEAMDAHHYHHPPSGFNAGFAR